MSERRLQTIHLVKRCNEINLRMDVLIIKK